MENRYSLCYRNSTWLYSVYRSDAGEHILVAVVPGVGWWDIAIILDADEVATLKGDKDAFTSLVNRFLYGREQADYKRRRIEGRIRNLDPETIALTAQASA